MCRSDLTQCLRNAASKVTDTSKNITIGTSSCLTGLCTRVSFTRVLLASYRFIDRYFSCHACNTSAWNTRLGVDPHYRKMGLTIVYY